LSDDLDARQAEAASYVRLPAKNGTTGAKGFTTLDKWLPWLRATIKAFEAREAATPDAPPLLQIMHCIVCGQPVSEIRPYKRRRRLLRRYGGIRLKPCGCRVTQRFIQPRWEDVL
jgi:hypothetical protein